MKTVFNGPLAEAMTSFVDWKRAQGLEYKTGHCRLGYFDRFLVTQKIDALLLTRQHLQAYQASLLPLGETSRYTLLLVARDFARYHQQIIPESAVMENMLFKKPAPPKPFIFSEVDILGLMQASRKRPTNTIMPHVMATLIGLLYVTGMRIGEALNLLVEDFHEAPYRLFIANSKFGKDRWIVLKDSTALALKAYLGVRRRFAHQAWHGPFFLNPKGNPLSYSSVRLRFLGLLEQCRIGLDCPGSRPRPHALRHNAASRIMPTLFCASLRYQGLSPF